MSSPRPVVPTSCAPVDLVVLEHQRRWAALCERAWGHGVVKLQECRSMQEATRALAERPWAIVAVASCFAPWPELYRWIQEQRRSSRAEFVLLGGRESSDGKRGPVHADHEKGPLRHIPTANGASDRAACSEFVAWTLREAGVIDMVRGIQDFPRWERWIRRHAVRVPQVEMPWRERLWSQLPWPKYEQKVN